MFKRSLLLILSLMASAALVAVAPNARAGDPEIQDPALDHPPPFADILSVDLALISEKGQPYLQVTWELAGDISGATRNLMIGYDFSAKVGKCDLKVVWYAYPQVTEPAGLPPGSAGAACGAKDLGGQYKLDGSKVSVQVAMRDMKGVSPGMKMTELKAWTAYTEGLAGDDTGVLASTGDVATSDKPWTIG